MILKPKTKVNFKADNLTVRGRYFDGLLVGYTMIRNSFILNQMFVGPCIIVITEE